VLSDGEETEVLFPLMSSEVRCDEVDIIIIIIIISIIIICFIIGHLCFFLEFVRSL
jgi:hypothetical protein